jgi:hypothetical protein
MSTPARRSIVYPCVSIGGLMILAYVLGAAAMHFQLPTAGYLDAAFTGARAWHEQRQALRGPITKAAPLSHDRDDPNRTCDGFTLYTTDHGAQAMLIDMQGNVVHRWTTTFRRIWSQPPHVRRPVDDDKIYMFACHLYANGDLLAVLHGSGDTPYGYGLAKLDKHSRVLWTYDANTHHAVDVAEDGTIYVLTHQIVAKMPEGLRFLAAPALVDFLVKLSPEGKELQKVSLLEAFRNSAYAALLTSRLALDDSAWDILHANHVEVLTHERATHFPRFRVGQVLVSARELDALAVVDVATASVTWAARGPWRGQHDPHFLDNGRLLVFDNRGQGRESRVLEYDPQTQACPWLYPEPSRHDDDPGAQGGGHSFFSPIQGRCQRLANGNTLVADSKTGALYEVTESTELVWACYCHAQVPFARRYAPEQLTFLPGDIHARR